jgi:AraC-like DNA-binding protein
MRPAEIKTRFLSQIGGNQQLLCQIMSLLPDVAFFVKDRQGCFVTCNQRSLEYFHAHSEDQVIGKTDHDFFPKDRATLYRHGDLRVMATGKSIINAVELAPEEEGSDRLISFSKVPVRNRRGRVIGVAGIHRELDPLRAPPRHFGRLSAAVQAMRERFAEPLGISDLAGLAGLSRSQFDRSFRHLFRTSPKEYLLSVRVNAACRLLADLDAKITQIALKTGFYDHSHFSRTFHRIMGISPLTFRRRRNLR